MNVVEEPVGWEWHCPGDGCGGWVTYISTWDDGHAAWNFERGVESHELVIHGIAL